MIKIFNTKNSLVVEPQFSIGNVVTHTRYNFRAVVVDVDGTFKGTEAEISKLTEADRSQQTNPWYHILVHGGEDLSYVPEYVLYGDSTCEPIQHPMLDKFLSPNVEKGHYQPNALMH